MFLMRAYPISKINRPRLGYLRRKTPDTPIRTLNTLIRLVTVAPIRAAILGLGENAIAIAAAGGVPVTAAVAGLAQPGVVRARVAVSAHKHFGVAGVGIDAALVVGVVAGGIEGVEDFGWVDVAVEGGAVVEGVCLQRGSDGAVGCECEEEVLELHFADLSLENEMF